MTLGIGPADFRTKLRAFLREHTLNIVMLMHRGDSTQGIAGQSRVNVARISRILTYLEAEGYIVRNPSETDSWRGRRRATASPRSEKHSSKRSERSTKQLIRMN